MIIFNIFESSVTVETGIAFNTVFRRFSIFSFFPAYGFPVPFSVFTVVYAQKNLIQPDNR
jgi:hypothetical protein